MIKVCLVARHANTRGTESVGTGRLTQELAMELIGRGVEVETIYDEGSSLLSYLLFSLFIIPLQLPKNYDIYHSIGPIESLWLPRKKLVVTFLDLFQYTNPDKVGGGIGYNKILNTLGVLYYKFCCNKAIEAEKVVCISKKTSEDLVEYLHILKQPVIKLGIPEYLNPEPKKDNILRFGYIGQLDKRKRVNLLIEAFKSTNLEAQLIIGGKGLDRDKLLKLAEGDSRIQFVGYIPEEELNSFYNSLDFFVFPSAIEGYGLPIIEAMACKKPVIVMKDANIPEEIKSRCIHSGYLKSTLESCYIDKENIDKEYPLEDNYKFAKEHSWKSMVDQYIEVYKELI